MRRSKGAIRRAEKKAAFTGYHFLDTETQIKMLRQTLVDDVVLAASRKTPEEVEKIAAVAQKNLDYAVQQMMKRLVKAVAWSKYSPNGESYAWS